MKEAPGKTGYLSTALLVLYILFFAGLLFSWRAVSSMSTGLLILTGIVYTRSKTGSFFPPGLRSFLFFACTGYLLLQAVFYFGWDQTERGLQELQLKTGLAALPLAYYFTAGYVASNKKKLVTAFLLLLAAGALYCLVRAIAVYIQEGDPSHFFYHALVLPLKQHAVYFSVLVYFAIVCLLQGLLSGQRYLSLALDRAMLVFFLFVVVLLSSKLVLSASILTVLYYGYLYSHTKTNSTILVRGGLLFLLTGLIILFATRNPVSNRFAEILKGKPGMMQQDHFRPDAYFNGLQFRLLQWKLVPEILREKNAWLTGVGAGRSQDLLTHKYMEKNMYTGDPGRAESGYGLYNTHNQWLESLLKNGLPGLLFFLLISAALAALALEKKKRVLSFPVILLLIYCFTEAILETQYGLVLFIFFPLFFSAEDEPTL